MTMPKSLAATPQPTPPQGQTLVAQVREAIRTQISKGSYKPGDRLPSEARLTQEFGVSRTVIREAVAALQSEKLVEPRQGAGVFVLEPPSGEGLAFRNLDLARVSSLIEMLELRTAVLPVLQHCGVRPRRKKRSSRLSTICAPGCGPANPRPRLISAFT